MTKLTRSETELKELIAAEFRRRVGDAEVDRDSFIIVERSSGWLATLRSEGPRIDEYRLAAVSEISRCLAAGYELDTATEGRASRRAG